MKTNLFRSAIVLLLSACALLGLNSCAEMNNNNTKSLLSAAGFRVRTPETPLQREVYAALTPYRVERATVKGRVFYVFKDEKEGVAYVGHEAEYQRYKNLAMQQRIAQDYYMAQSMARMDAYRWYGAWGPRGMYW